VTETAQTRPNHTVSGGQTTTSKVPCFPSLLLIPPAASSKPPSAVDGHVRLCLLCFRLLLEQWKSYEKRKTPMSNRQYWLKCCAANRDNFDSIVSKLNSGRSNATDSAHHRQSPSPDAVLEDAQRDNRSSNLRVSGDSIDQLRIQDKRRKTAASSTGNLRSVVTLDPQFPIRQADSIQTVCVVCSRSIESMDVCRRLPAHLVAQIVDVKPTVGQVSGQTAANANLTGEALVCDECFATPSFQNAWLDCCRRGGQSLHQTPMANPAQGQQVPNRELEQIQLPANELLLQSAQNQTLSQAQRQWFALYEHALLQFHLTGQLDPLLVGQLQQLAAAEALASLQHSGTVTTQDVTSSSNNDRI